MTFEFGQDTSFVGDHLIFAEVRLGYRPVMAGDAVAIEYRLHFQAESKRPDASYG